MHQLLADLREDRGVRELEEKEASHKGKKADILEESPTADPIGLGRMMIGSATGSAKVNIGAAYPKERQ
jgi:hypothetical protein